nr:bidirectional sugar transporter SWEET4-like [Tanacetum cinerariifolium]
MVSQEAVRTALGVLGNISAITLFLSAIPTFYIIWKKRSIEQYSPVPFVQPNSLLVVISNGAGVVIEACYLVIFLTYSDPKKRFKVALMVLVEILAIGILVLFMLTTVDTTQMRSTIVGSIGLVANILMYASPLSIM